MAAGVVQHEGGGKAARAGGHLQGIGVAELAGVALLRCKVRRRRALVLRITAASIEDAGAEDSARGGEGLADRVVAHGEDEASGRLPGLPGSLDEGGRAQGETSGVQVGVGQFRGLIVVNERNWGAGTQTK